MHWKQTMGNIFVLQNWILCAVIVCVCVCVCVRVHVTENDLVYRSEHKVVATHVYLQSHTGGFH